MMRRFAPFRWARQTSVEASGAAFRAALVALLAFTPGLADQTVPVEVRIREREPGAFLVEWRVPKVFPPEWIPTPVLPEGCRPEGERVFLDQSIGWLSRQVYRCPQGLAGRTLGITYPIYNPSLTTVFRVELLSGERYVHALSPREESWRVPETGAGSFEGWLTCVRSAVLTGLRHVLRQWVHLTFVMVVILLGGATGSVRLVTAFGVGQLVGVPVAALLGPAFEPRIADVCVALAVMFLAREALRPPSEGRRRSAGFAGGAGLFHGVALTKLVPAASDSAGVDWTELFTLVLGMDATLVVLALGVTSAGRLMARRRSSARLRPLFIYVAGGAAVAAALSLAVAPPTIERVDTRRRSLPMTSTTLSTSLPGSRRVAPQTGDAAIQSYLAVEPFEVRHEVLLRLGAVARDVDLDVPDDGYLEIDAQEDVVRRLADFVASRAVVEIDGQPADGFSDRSSFVTVDATGVLPRQTPVREPVDDAFVGVTIVYTTEGLPEQVTLTWREIGGAVTAIPATVIDPEATRSTKLTAQQPVLRWKNELMENAVLAVAGVAVEPPEFPVPILSSALLAATVTLLVLAFRGRRPAVSFAAARVLLALALIAAPVAQVAVALPSSIRSAISARQAQSILASVLPNVYRAFEFRDEAAVYDRLAVAVTGETLGDVYLEHRRALEVVERGGARARVDAVEVLDVRSIEPSDDGGFDADASWTVCGTVTHFGHRHFRRNRYDARVTVIPAGGVWKIRTIEILNQERVK